MTLNNKVSLLITLLYEGTLLRCAIKTDMDILNDDVLTYPMEPEHNSTICNLLPNHIKSCGPVVEVQQIFDVCIL